MVRPSSVVVLVVHLIAIPTVERERDPPVSIDVHGPLALPPALERMKAKPGGVEIADTPGGFEPCQDSTDLRNVVRVQAPEVAGLEEPLQPTMPEADDHGRTVPCNVSPVNGPDLIAGGARPVAPGARGAAARLPAGPPRRARPRGTSRGLAGRIDGTGACGLVPGEPVDGGALPDHRWRVVASSAVEAEL